MPPYKHKPNTPRMDLYSQIIMFIPNMSNKHIIVFCNTFTFYKRHFIYFCFVVRTGFEPAWVSFLNVVIFAQPRFP